MTSCSPQNATGQPETPSRRASTTPTPAGRSRAGKRRGRARSARQTSPAAFTTCDTPASLGCLSGASPWPSSRRSSAGAPPQPSGWQDAMDTSGTSLSGRRLRCWIVSKVKVMGHNLRHSSRTSGKRGWLNSLKRLAPQVGLEPTTLRLTAVAAEFLWSGTESYHVAKTAHSRHPGGFRLIRFCTVSYHVSPQIPPHASDAWPPCTRSVGGLIGDIVLRRSVCPASGFGSSSAAMP